jgi:hypothetical protein
VAASILTAIYHMLKDGVGYNDLGAEHFDGRSAIVKAIRVSSSASVNGVLRSLRGSSHDGSGLVCFFLDISHSSLWPLFPAEKRAAQAVDSFQRPGVETSVGSSLSCHPSPPALIEKHTALMTI